jgi:hypothetical protein
MLHFEDLKVLSANAVCMAVLSFQNINALLQSILFLSTIIYTIVRLLNEVKNNKAKNDNAGSS